MSLFNDLEQTGSIHLPDDSDSTKVSTYDWDTIDYAISINVIRMGPEEQIIFAEEQATYRANVSGTNASQIVKGAGIKVGTDKYQVTDVKLNKLFSNTYSIRLRELVP